MPFVAHMPTTFAHPHPIPPSPSPDDPAAAHRDRAAGAGARRAAAARLARRRSQCAALLGRLLVAGCLPREQDEWLGGRVVGLLADGAHPLVGAPWGWGVCGR